MRASASLARRAAAATAAAAAATTLRRRWSSHCERFQDLPAEYADQRFRPAAPYPAWDSNWDRCAVTAERAADALRHEWPIGDYPQAIRRLYAEHTGKPPAEVEQLIESERDDLPALYVRAYLRYAYGGAATRHIILVRHGQYEEQRELVRAAEKADRDFGLTPAEERFVEVDATQVLTPLGRRQAAATGSRLAGLLRPALRPGREADVRLHVSSSARARETAELIAARLPPHVRRMAPDPNLAEGWPPAHRIPYPKGAVEEESRLVHVEGARLEAAYRGLFYRGRPPTPPAEPPAATGEAQAAAQGEGGEISKKFSPRHEYDIVVCHGNVIRFFALRALQLPPEAWLRLCFYNCSLTHIELRPTGGVSLVSAGETAHLTLEETTYGNHVAYEW